MNQARWIPMLLILSWGLACGGCGGGGGGGGDGSPGPAPDLSGWWFEEWDDRDDPDGWAPAQVVELVDDGSTVSYGTRLLHKDGWSLSLDVPNATDPDRRLWRFAIQSEDRVDGLYETYLDDTVLTAQLRRLTATAPPVGTLVINGAVEGEAVSVDATHGYALEQGAAGASTVVWIFDADAGGTTSIALLLTTPAHLPVGTHDVGAGVGEMHLEVRTESLWGIGADGNVELTHSTADRIAGWYIVDLDGGSSITGSFDARIWRSNP